MLITGERFSEGVHELRALGVTTAFLPADTLIQTLRRGSTFDFAADVILIDGTTGNPMRSSGTLLAYRISEAIGQLSDMYVMPSGLRWNAAPRVVLGEEAGFEAHFQSPKANVTYLSDFEMLEGGIYSFGRTASFWHRVHAALEKRHFAFSPMLAESMQSLGVLFAETHGQTLRNGLRPGVRRDDLESQFYAASHDRFFDAKNKGLRRVLSVFQNGPDATAYAIAELARIAFDPRAREAVPEELSQLHPYFFDIAQHEALTQRSFRFGAQTFRFDMLRRETGIPGRPHAELFEFKRGGFAQSRGFGLTHSEYQGVEQVELYLEMLRSDDAMARRRLGSSFLKATTRVVGGYARGADPTALKRARKRFPESEIEGWDEVALRNARRFGASHGWEPGSGQAS